jgi:hypothetical protein
MTKDQLIKDVLLKLNDAALMELYRHCGDLANKYYLLSRYAIVNEQTYHKMLLTAIAEAESEYYVLKGNADNYYSRYCAEYKRRAFHGLLKLPWQ